VYDDKSMLKTATTKNSVSVIEKWTLKTTLFVNAIK
jgi:hypothetical protein